MTAMAVESDDVMPAEPAANTFVATRAVAGAFAVTALLLAGVVTLVGNADSWRGYGAATVATAMACIATIPIIVWGMRAASTRPELAAGAFFVSAGARAVIVLGAASLAVFQGHYPKTPTMLMVVPYYFAILAAETFVVVRPLWSAKPTTTTKSDNTEPKP